MSLEHLVYCLGGYLVFLPLNQLQVKYRSAELSPGLGTESLCYGKW